MRTSLGRGRIYRRCGCRDTQHHQLGAHCPYLLTDSQHGTWNFAVDVPAPGHRTTVRRGGFPTQDSAEQALGRFLEGEVGGYNADPSQTVAAYLNTWLEAKALVLKPTTMARYRDYVRNDLIPAFGGLKLDQLAHRHISAFVTCQLAAGRGHTTLYRCLATLSSALGDAVRQHRLPHNPASPPVLRRPPAPERRIWTAEEAVRFLLYCHRADPEIADLSSSVPACARAKPWACTGTTSTSPKASCTCAAPSPRSTTTTSSSPRRRPAPAAPGSRSRPASPPPYDTGRRQ
ncbi:tyrosine-type recombinase/integrase family protein [Streptomyces sp. ISL-86]|nr:tyrosine-type recombinase/integrase family protein [Streptomyces sp. ISL-86]